MVLLFLNAYILLTHKISSSWKENKNLVPSDHDIVQCCHSLHDSQLNANILLAML